MFPKTNVNLNTGAVETQDSTDKTSLKFDFESGDFILNDGRVVECSGNEALKIWVEKIIRTEKARYKIYEDTEYGIVLEDLIIGSVYPKAFIESELKREIEDALLQHDKIIGISSFEVLHVGHKLAVSFEVKTATSASLAQEVVFNV